jgi:cation diffusion facilitator CzcD-associated flavoprotein CzcO
VAATNKNSEAQHRGVRPQVVIVGAGFGGLKAAWSLRRAEADVRGANRQWHRWLLQWN